MKEKSLTRNHRGKVIGRRIIEKESSRRAASGRHLGLREAMELQEAPNHKDRCPLSECKSCIKMLILNCVLESPNPAAGKNCLHFSILAHLEKHTELYIIQSTACVHFSIWGYFLGKKITIVNHCPRPVGVLWMLPNPPNCNIHQNLGKSTILKI